jgi:HEAT repeat protein
MSERRAQQRSGAEDRIAGVLVAAGDAFLRGEWTELLAWAEAARQLSEGQGVEERRSMMIAARRTFNPEVLRAMLDRALRTPEEQTRTAAVLRWIGPEGHEAMIDSIRESENVAPRQFLHDALAAEPAAYPLLVPLLSNSKPHIVRHGAELLGRLGDPRAVDSLGMASQHPAERVRAAAINALAKLGDPAGDPFLDRALAHLSPATRTDAARAIHEHDLARLLPVLLEAFDRDTESVVRRELANAAARLGAAERVWEIAMERKGLLLRWRGRPLDVRLDAVAGLAAADTTEARRLLDRLVREGDAPIRDAADRALSVRRVAAD